MLPTCSYTFRYYVVPFSLLPASWNDPYVALILINSIYFCLDSLFTMLYHFPQTDDTYFIHHSFCCHTSHLHMYRILYNFASTQVNKVCPQFQE